MTDHLAPHLDHVARALAFPCEVCKAQPHKPCIDGPQIVKPVLDGYHTKRVYRGLYGGAKMPPIFADPSAYREREPQPPRVEIKESLEEVIARTTATWEAQRKPGRKSWADDSH